MDKIWDAIGEFLVRLVPEFIRHMILKWLNAREEASLDAFAADRLQKSGSTDPREVANYLLRKNMVLEVFALVSQNEERKRALLVTGNYGMMYLMALTDLKLPFVVPITRDKKLVDKKEYQALWNHRTVHLCIYVEGEEDPREIQVWGIDETEPLGLQLRNATKTRVLGIAPDQLLEDCTRYGHIQWEKCRRLKGLRTAKHLADRL